ncbi:hypothetical protein ACFX11_031907 [Malus domestica]
MLKLSVSSRYQLPPCRFDMKNVPNYNLGVLKGCLSVTVYSLHSIIIWVMKEFGVKESWTQERNICSNTCLRPSDYPQLVNLTEEGKVLLLENCGILRAYSPSTRDLARVEIDGIAWVGGARVHISNFVSLKDVSGF